MQMTIDLAPISRSDLPQLMAWRNDWRILAWTRQADLLNEVEHADWFERQARDLATRMYKLVLRASGATTDVGVCGLTSIDYRHSRAEFSLYVAPQFQGKGIGRHALAVLLAHGFMNLGLNLIWGETFDGNRATKTFEALGMKREGTRRSFYWKDGKRIDAHLYSITRDEWHGLSNSDPGPPRSQPSASDGGLAAVPIQHKGRKGAAGRVEAPPEPEPPEGPRAA